MSEDSDARAFEDFATAKRKEIAELRASVALLENSLSLSTDNNAEYAKRHVAQLERIAHLQIGLSAQTQRGDAYCDRLEQHAVKMDALTTENQRLRADSERLDWLSAHSREVYKTATGWCAGGDLAFTFHADLRSAIDAGRGK